VVAGVGSGTTAEWVQAVGVMGAFAVTGFAIVREMRMNRLSREHLLADRQARYVASWTGGWDVVNEMAEINYRNGSQEPIYGVALRVLSQERKDSAPDWTAVGTVAPGAEATVTLSFREVQDVVSSLPAGLPVEMVFRDSTDLWWRRSASGKLSILHEQPFE
jgi:hypothetical protein